MTNVRPSAPPPPPDDTDATRVRVRRGDVSLPPASGTDAKAWGEHTERMTQKLGTARVLLASLPVSHPQAGLLRIAILRRDETLLDGLLLALRERPSTFPMQRTTVPPKSTKEE